ncbi:Uncharacterised protein [Streptococcus pneumoniae]|nr:Uncharacterised protein [Streptococcus pneumoniae]
MSNKATPYPKAIPTPNIPPRKPSTKSKLNKAFILSKIAGKMADLSKVLDFLVLEPFLPGLADFLFFCFCWKNSSIFRFNSFN